MLITSSEVLKTKLTAVQRPVVSSEFSFWVNMDTWDINLNTAKTDAQKTSKPETVF